MSEGIFEHLAGGYLRRAAERDARIEREVNGRILKESRDRSLELLSGAKKALREGEVEKADELAYQGMVEEMAALQFKAHVTWGL